jgi:hypothetical protein
MVLARYVAAESALSRFLGPFLLMPLFHDSFEPSLNAPVSQGSGSKGAASDGIPAPDFPGPQSIPLAANSR